MAALGPASHDFHVRVQSLQDKNRVGFIIYQRIFFFFLFRPSLGSIDTEASSQTLCFRLLVIGKIKRNNARADLITLEDRPFRVDTKRKRQADAVWRRVSGDMRSPWVSGTGGRPKQPDRQSRSRPNGRNNINTHTHAKQTAVITRPTNNPSYLGSSE